MRTQTSFETRPTRQMYASKEEGEYDRVVTCSVSIWSLAHAQVFVVDRGLK